MQEVEVNQAEYLRRVVAYYYSNMVAMIFVASGAAPAIVLESATSGQLVMILILFTASVFFKSVGSAMWHTGFWYRLWSRFIEIDWTIQEVDASEFKGSSPQVIYRV